MLKTPIAKLRFVGFLEGLSLILLLFICLPLKYLFHEPMGVKIMGSIHGTLFLIYLMLSLSTAMGESWRFKECVRVWLAALLPFGTFINDPFLASKQKSMTRET